MKDYFSLFPRAWLIHRHGRDIKESSICEIEADRTFLALVDASTGRAPDRARRYLKFVFEKIYSGNTLIVRNAPSSYDLLDLPLVAGYGRYFDDTGRSEIKITVDPWNKWDAERRVAGVFHTDFSQSDRIPDIVAVQCNRIDPRYPHYGRNQTVGVIELLKELDKYFPDLSMTLSRNSLPYVVRGLRRRSVALNYTPFPWMKYHPSYLDTSMLDRDWAWDNVRIDSIIEEVAHSKCHDFVLNHNDIFFCSNKACLHRRGESSVVLMENGAIESRIITTRRFLRRQ